MDIRGIILQGMSNYSPQEKKLADYLLNNLSTISTSSLKAIANKLQIQKSVISSMLKKIGLGGFKNFRYVLDNQCYQEHIKTSNIIDTYEKQIIKDIKKTSSLLKTRDQLLKLINIIKTENYRQIILYSTGKTKKIVDFLYFNLLENNINCKVFSSLYDSELLDVESKIVIVFSISGNNNKISRFLKLVKQQNPLVIVSITSTLSCNFKEFLDLHIYGSCSTYFSKDGKVFPIGEKTPIWMIIDLFLIYLKI